MVSLFLFKYELYTSPHASSFTFSSRIGRNSIINILKGLSTWISPFSLNLDENYENEITDCSAKEGTFKRRLHEALQRGGS
jgi:hypothetical protein